LSPPAVPLAGAAPIPATIAAAEPEPPFVREYVEGNRYLNQTFGFEMYRPPGWEMIGDAEDAFPGAIAALGATDETAAVIVSRERISEAATRAGDPLDAQATVTDRNLRRLYENYRVQSSSRTTVAGEPAVEQRANGVADGRDWSVRVITFGRGGDIFTILAMTSANSDLIQIRQNVLAKMIASLRFNSAL
jgi:hypothetical protein